LSWGSQDHELIPSEVSYTRKSRASDMKHRLVSCFRFVLTARSSRRSLIFLFCRHEHQMSGLIMLSSLDTTHQQYNYTNVTCSNETGKSGSQAADGDLSLTDFALLVILILFVIIIVIGNLLVVLAISCYKKLRTITNMMILSLAVADLLIGIIVMPFAIAQQILNYWPYGQAWCNLWHAFDVLSSTASILNLVVISLDRYWAVTNPIAYPRLMSHRRGLISISLAWLCSIAISFPMIAWWSTVDPVIEGQCYFTEDTIYLLISSTVSFYIPMVVMVVVYMRIFLTIRTQSLLYLAARHAQHRNSNVLRAHRGGYNNAITRSEAYPTMEKSPMIKIKSSDSVTSHSRTPSFSKTNSDLPLMTPSQTKRPVSKSALTGNEYRVARTLGAVMGIFLCCWLPFFVCNLITAFCKDCILNAKLVMPIVTWLGYINSGVNPFIYSLSMKHMRRAFVKLLCLFRIRRKHCNRTPPVVYHTANTGVSTPMILDFPINNDNSDRFDRKIT